MKHGQKAWLVIWEWNGQHAAVEDQIAAILRPRLSKDIVGEIVECLYAVHEYSLRELAYWSKRPKENPYKAIWHNGHCYCGHNPSLHAHYVHDLVVKEDKESGLETISWVYPPIFRMNTTTWQPEQVRGNLAASTTRTITGPLSDRETGRYAPHDSSLLMPNKSPS